MQGPDVESDRSIDRRLRLSAAKQSNREPSRAAAGQRGGPLLSVRDRRRARRRPSVHAEPSGQTQRGSAADGSQLARGSQSSQAGRAVTGASMAASAGRTCASRDGAPLSWPESMMVVMRGLDQAPIGRRRGSGRERRGSAGLLRLTMTSPRAGVQRQASTGYVTRVRRAESRSTGTCRGVAVPAACTRCIPSRVYARSPARPASLRCRLRAAAAAPR